MYLDMIAGNQEPTSGENVFRGNTSRMTGMYASMLGVLAGLESERVGVLKVYDFDEDMVSKQDSIALDILDKVTSEIQNCVVGLELYGKLK